VNQKPYNMSNVCNPLQEKKYYCRSILGRPVCAILIHEHMS